MNKFFGGITSWKWVTILTVKCLLLNAAEWKQFQNSRNYDDLMSSQKGPYFRWL